MSSLFVHRVHAGDLLGRHVRPKHTERKRKPQAGQTNEGRLALLEQIAADLRMCEAERR